MWWLGLVSAEAEVTHRTKIPVSQKGSERNESGIRRMGDGRRGWSLEGDDRVQVEVIRLPLPVPVKWVLLKV